MKAKIDCIEEPAPPGPVDANGPGLLPKYSTAENVARSERLIGDRRGHLVRITEATERLPHGVLAKYAGVGGCGGDVDDALEVGSLRPNEFEHHQQEKVDARQAALTSVARHAVGQGAVEPALDAPHHAPNDGAAGEVVRYQHATKDDVVTPRAANAGVGAQVCVARDPLHSLNAAAPTPLGRVLLGLATRHCHTESEADVEVECCCYCRRWGAGDQKPNKRGNYQSI